MNIGIYEIRNTETGDVYIGQTIDFKMRWSVHRGYLRSGEHVNRYLQNAWNKYGEAKFKFTILETCEPGVLNAREQFYIDKAFATPGQVVYNLSPVSKKGFLTEDGRDRKRHAMRGNLHTFGRVRPESERLAISAGNKGKKRSPEAIENYRKAAQKREAESRAASQAIPVTKPWERGNA